MYYVVPRGSIIGLINLNSILLEFTGKPDLIGISED
jgi:hypothetical protein